MLGRQSNCRPNQLNGNRFEVPPRFRAEENPRQANRYPVQNRRGDEQRREAVTLLHQAGNVRADRAAEIPSPGSDAVERALLGLRSQFHMNGAWLST